MIRPFAEDATVVEQHAAAQANHDSKCEQARVVYEKAKRDLGSDLAGYSLVDLLADNFPWSLEQCRQIAQAVRS